MTSPPPTATRRRVRPARRRSRATVRERRSDRLPKRSSRWRASRARGPASRIQRQASLESFRSRPRPGRPPDQLGEPGGVFGIATGAAVFPGATSGRPRLPGGARAPARRGESGAAPMRAGARWPDRRARPGSAASFAARAGDRRTPSVAPRIPAAAAHRNGSAAARGFPGSGRAPRRCAPPRRRPAAEPPHARRRESAGRARGRGSRRVAPRGAREAGRRAGSKRGPGGGDGGRGPRFRRTDPGGSRRRAKPRAALTVKSRRSRSFSIDPPSISAMSSGRRPATRNTRGPGRSRERNTARPRPADSSARATASAFAGHRHVDLRVGDPQPRVAHRAADEPGFEAELADAARASDRTSPRRRRRRSAPGEVGATGFDASDWYNFEDAILLFRCHSRGGAPGRGAGPAPAPGERASPLDRAALPHRRATSTSSSRSPRRPSRPDPGAPRPTPARATTSRPGRSGREALEDNAPRRSHGYGVVPRVVGSGS